MRLKPARLSGCACQTGLLAERADSPFGEG